MIALIRRLAAMSGDRRAAKLRDIADQRGKPLARYILNRICAATWGDCPDLARRRATHRRRAVLSRRAKATAAPMRLLWEGITA